MRRGPRVLKGMKMSESEKKTRTLSADSIRIGAVLRVERAKLEVRNAILSRDAAAQKHSGKVSAAEKSLADAESKLKALGE